MVRACRRSAFTDHRGARPARHRRPVPLAGAADAGREPRLEPARHQRLSNAAQLCARAVAEPLRAHTRRLGRRAVSTDPSRTRSDGFCPGRHRCRCRSVRWPSVTGEVPRRMRRRSQPGPQERRYRLSGVGSVGQLFDCRGGDGGRTGVGRAPRRPGHQRHCQAGGGQARAHRVDRTESGSRTP